MQVRHEGVVICDGCARACARGELRETGLQSLRTLTRRLPFVLAVVCGLPFFLNLLYYALTEYSVR